MIKLVAIALATFFSAGIAVDVDAGAPAPEQTTTLPDDATPVPASYNSCVDQCNTELSACEQACTTPMCV
ncbi:MAG: hypothetical protein KDK70_06555, partial [Myxococcales bacterium]|nr:hypothetical protein [Myxococcales bacterium]